jgi:hypothetical protein
VATNAAGQATAAGLTPTAAGAIHINVAAAFQGQTVTAAITQTNVLTAAQAAGAASGGGGGSAGAAGTAGGAAGGGGIGLTTIAIIGGAVAGGAIAAVQTGVIGGSDVFMTIKGVVFDTVHFGGVCTVPAGGGGADIQAPRECYGNAVAGAVVSTSLDPKTATTDGGGNFDLITATLESDMKCRTYTLTITAAGLPTYSIPVTGFATSNSSHRQQFAFTPPTPSSMNGGC